jgi:DNA-binding MarR family transcriptional regulator
MRLMWGVSHGLQSISKRMEVDLGVTGPQRLVVRILGRYPGLSAGQVARILHLHPSTLTGVLRRLEERRLVDRTAGEQDRREARLRLTAMGRWLDRRQAGTVEGAVRSVLARLEPRKVKAAAEVLRALDGALRGEGLARGSRSTRGRDAGGPAAPSRTVEPRPRRRRARRVNSSVKRQG